MTKTIKKNANSGKLHSIRGRLIYIFNIKKKL